MSDYKFVDPDEDKPWTIKAMPAKARRLATESAPREDMTVGDWVARAILQFAGRADQPPAIEEAVKLADAVARLSASGVKVNRQTASGANRVIQACLNALAPPEPKTLRLPGKPKGKPANEDTMDISEQDARGTSPVSG